MISMWYLYWFAHTNVKKSLNPISLNNPFEVRLETLQ